MGKRKLRNLLISLEIVFLVAITLFVFICTLNRGGLLVHLEPAMESVSYFIGECIYGIMPTLLIFLIVVGIDIAWIVLIVKWSRLKNVYWKIFFTWFILVISVFVCMSVWTCYIFDNMF